MLLQTLVLLFLGSIACQAQAPIECQTIKLTHDQAMTYLNQFGIGVSSTGGCSDANTKGCTSLDNINCVSICALIKYKQDSGCPVTVTAGTEVGHSGGARSHSNGYKIDIRLSKCHSDYIKSSFKYIGRRSSDSASKYEDAQGNVYAKEGNHWDNLYLKC